MRGAQSFAEEEYIDLDLSSCGEVRVRVCRSKRRPRPALARTSWSGGPGSTRSRRGRGASCCLIADAGATGGCGRRGTATVAPLQHSSHAEGLLARGGLRPAQEARQGHAGEAAGLAGLPPVPFAQDLVLRRPVAAAFGPGAAGPRMTRGASVMRQAGIGQSKSSYVSSAAPTTLRAALSGRKLMDEEGARGQRPATQVLLRRDQVAAGAIVGEEELVWSAPTLKRSSSCRSESEGLVQGAIAYCKRSQQQRVLLARKSVSDARPLLLPCPLLVLLFCKPNPQLCSSTTCA
ncbi:hypothetical protein D1007_17752 [Hordeum vulgare]|nr:hypothetical protein D1007_17752 [Hordeum vulgare]